MLAWLNRRRADWLAVLLITLVVAAFFAPVWAGGLWMPAGGGDLASFLWPTYTFAARTLPGELPLWNPHQYSGAPFWADNQSGVLYPPLLLLSLLTDSPSYAALEALVILHVWLAGLAMFACLRLIRPSAPIPPAAAALGGIAFMLSDVFVTHLGNLNLIAAAAWLPLIGLGTWRALTSGSSPTSGSEAASRASRGVGWAILAGLTFGLGALAGHAQMTYFSGLLAGAMGLWHLVATLLARDWRGAIRVIAILAGIGLLAFGLSAAALLPALELTGHTARAGLDYASAAAYSLPPRALIGLVAPWVYGRGPAAFTGNWDRVEVGYIGVLALGLALVGLWRGLRRRDPLAVFLALFGGIALLLALGEYFPLHRLAYELVPGMRSIRVPARFVLLFDFAGAALAALALTPGRALSAQGLGAGHAGDSSPRLHSQKSLLKQALGWGLRVIESASADLVSLARDLSRGRFSGRRVPEQPVGGSQADGAVPRPTPWILAILVGIELIAFGAGSEVQAADPTTGYAHADAVAWLAEQPGAPFRIEGGPAAAVWQPDLPSLAGGPLYDSYGISNPLTLAAYEAWYWGVGQRGSAAYNFLGIKYVLAPTGGEPPGDSSFVPVYEAPSGVTVYLNTGSLPLAQLVYKAEPVDSPEAAWVGTHDPAWDPRALVYVEGGPALDSDPPEGANLFFTVYEPNTLAVVVQTPAPAYLVLAEAFYPGWEATIDGAPVPIVRANTAFRAVYLPEPGEHTVLLRFRPPSVIAGLAASAITLTACIAGGIATLRRRRASP